MADDLRIPEWDIADRMRKALRESGLKSSELAEYLGVTHWTVSRWLVGRVVPDKRTLILWAEKTNVPYDWLVNG